MTTPRPDVQWPPNDRKGCPLTALAIFGAFVLGVASIVTAVAAVIHGT